MTWQGMGFPIELVDGGFPVSIDLENIRECIWIILSTRRGERVMRPDFGSNFFNLVDNPINEKFKANLRYEVYRAIEEWEPRIKTRKVNIYLQNPYQVVITVEFVILVTDEVATVEYIYDREEKKWLK